MSGYKKIEAIFRQIVSWQQYQVNGHKTDKKCIFYNIYTQIDGNSILITNIN